MLMEIEHLIRYAPRAVGLKPSAMECKARLRGLWRIIYSKTIISAYRSSHRDTLPELGALYDTAGVNNDQCIWEML